MHDGKEERKRIYARSALLALLVKFTTPAKEGME